MNQTEQSVNTSSQHTSDENITLTDDPFFNVEYSNFQILIGFQFKGYENSMGYVLDTA